MLVLQVLALVLTLVTMAGETTGKRCTARIVGGSGKRQRGPTERRQPAESLTRFLRALRRAVSSIFLSHLSFPLHSTSFLSLPCLTSPFSLFLPFSCYHAFLFALARFLPLLFYSNVCYCVNVWNIVDSISSQPPAVDRNVDVAVLCIRKKRKLTRLRFVCHHLWARIFVKCLAGNILVYLSYFKIIYLATYFSSYYYSFKGTIVLSLFLLYF